MESTQEKELKDLKRKVLEKKNKIEAVLFELREINEFLDNFQLPPENDYNDRFTELNRSIINLTKEISTTKNNQLTTEELLQGIQNIFTPFFDKIYNLIHSIEKQNKKTLHDKT
jgi:hypothetical protein